MFTNTSVTQTNMKYTYPNNFDRNRADDLHKLVDEAYNQLNQGTVWQPPTGYSIAATLSAKEFWKLPPGLSDIISHMLKPVPFGFVATKGAEVFVIIRGTKTPLEWMDDFTALPVSFKPSGKDWGKTTQGLNTLYANLGPQINSAISQLQAGGIRLTAIYISGHSLGAAIAHLAAAGIAAQFNVKPISYTFSGPRAGDEGFAAAFAAAGLVTWRMYNTEDIVPTVPPAAVQLSTPNMGMHGLTPMTQALSTFVQLGAVGYEHVGYPISATFHRATVADNHSMDDLIAEVNAQ